jgi:putative transposase
MFKHHRYPKAVILQAVYFKLRFTLSYRDVEQLFSIRGVQVDDSTVQRWVYKFSSEIEKDMRKRKRSRCAASRLRRSATSEDQTLVPGTSKLESKTAIFIEL